MSIHILGPISKSGCCGVVSVADMVEPQMVEGEDKWEVLADSDCEFGMWNVPLDTFNSRHTILRGAEVVLVLDTSWSSSVISPSSRLSWSVMDNGVWRALHSPSGGNANASAGLEEKLSVILMAYELL
jgi:hypothetical protein